jgi:type II secretion system protein I
MITVAILSTAIVFALRAFAVVLSGVRFSQNITLACLLAEDKIWEAEMKQKENKDLLKPASGKETMQGRDFNWEYEVSDTDSANLKFLKFTVSWQEKRENPYSLEFFTYILSKNQ